MKKIILNNKGLLIPADVEFFGGKYSFLERVKMKGIGSPKVIYKSGVPYFDEVETVENEISFANFELMKNGFLIRFHRNQKHRYVGFKLHELVGVQFEEVKDYSKKEHRLLLIKTTNHQIKFEILSSNFPSVLSFFKKKIFEDIFQVV